MHKLSNTALTKQIKTINIIIIFSYVHIRIDFYYKLV